MHAPFSRIAHNLTRCVYIRWRSPPLLEEDIDHNFLQHFLLTTERCIKATSMTTSKQVAYVKVSTPSIRNYDEDDDLSDLEDAQSISGSNIDPAKLAALLRIKFGAGTYDIHVSAAYVANLENTLVKS
jgi:hypothetical protein